MGSVSKDSNNASPRDSGAPEDVGARWKQLQDLLGSEVEFEARYPAAYDILFPDAKRPERSGLLLPSFGIRVLQSAPEPYVDPPHAPFGSDAYSATYLHRRFADQGRRRAVGIDESLKKRELA